MSDIAERTPVELDRVIIRFAGDSGDGMQLTGDRFTSASALLGNDLATLPEYPAEIRAPAGTVFGVELSRSILPMASMPAGGFIVLGVVCAVWRALARKQREYLKNEARGYLAVHPQSQESGKEEKE